MIIINIIIRPIHILLECIWCIIMAQIIVNIQYRVDASSGTKRILTSCEYDFIILRSVNQHTPLLRVPFYITKIRQFYIIHALEIYHKSYTISHIGQISRTEFTIQSMTAAPVICILTTGQEIQWMHREAQLTFDLILLDKKTCVILDISQCSLVMLEILEGF